jgi:hypothetical protein
MKLIEAIVVASQEYGTRYGDWKAIHSNGCCIGRAPRGVYLAFDLNLIAQSLDCLEIVIARFGEKYPHELIDEGWKVSRWESPARAERNP